MILLPLRRIPRLRPRTAPLTAAAVLIAYGGLAGGDAPVIRAVIFGVLGAFAIWKGSPWTGRGANAYMRAMEEEMSIVEGDPYFTPAHNMVIFVTTELGVIGLFFFYGLIGAIGVRCWKVIHHPDPLLRVLALALFASFVAHQIAGLFDPIYITSVPYFLLWFYFGLSSALYRMSESHLRPELI